MSTDAQIKSEIARLTASINQHKSIVKAPAYRPNVYVNPNYRPPTNQYVRPATSRPPSSRPPPPTQPKEVVLNGVAFQSSNRSLVRKDLPTPPQKPVVAKPSVPQPTRRPNFLATQGARVYKPKSSRGRRRGGPVNMTLNNSRRPYQSVRPSHRLFALMHNNRSGRRVTKQVSKPCPRFTMTGTCARGLTCPYLHDPAKIAICWNFLQGNCPNTAETCNLSHDPTPERTPLCLHFLNKGRCTRVSCLFPHVNVGARQGVCRDFAVLGYCERGLDCDKQHVRECPDFAERGECATPRCKLPHVIRANRTRKPAPTLAPVAGTSKTTNPTSPLSAADSSSVTVSAENAQLGDEFISLTFHESESDEDDESEEESEEEEDSEEEDASMVTGDRESPGEAD